MAFLSEISVVPMSSSCVKEFSFGLVGSLAWSSKSRIFVATRRERLGWIRFSQASFQKKRHLAWQPPCAAPLHRRSSRCTVFHMRREPVLLIVSHVLSDLLYTLNCLPQYSSISGMNGSASNRPCESSVRKISASLRTSTVSPGRSRKLVAFFEPTCSIQSFLILAAVTEGNAPISWEKCICLLQFYPGRRRWTQAWTLHVQ